MVMHEAAGRASGEASAVAMLETLRHSMGVLQPELYESPGKATREKIFDEQVRSLQEVDHEKRKLEQRERRQFRQSLLEHQQRVKLIALHGREAAIGHSASMPSLSRRHGAASAGSLASKGAGGATGSRGSKGSRPSLLMPGSSPRCTPWWGDGGGSESSSPRGGLDRLERLLVGLAHIDASLR